MPIEPMDSHVFPDIWQREYPVIDHGEGIYLFDTSGKRYIDSIGGIHVVTIGHGVVEIADAMAKQAKKVAYVNVRKFDKRSSGASRECNNFDGP